MLDDIADVLTAERLVLRPLRRSDAGPISLYAGDARVARATARLPHPYPPGAAEAFIEGSLSGRLSERAWAIDLTPSGGAELAGVVSVMRGRDRPGLGYWVGPPYWNTGYASEAVQRVCIHLFDDLGVAEIGADVFSDNEASARVLLRCGFAEEPGEKMLHSVARGGMVESRAFTLRGGSGLAIDAGGVRIDPLRPADAADLARLGNDESIARMLSSVPHPFTEADAVARIAASRWQGRPGFRAAIRLADGPLIGEIALGPEEEPSLGYWIGRAHWGQGHAGRAVTAFVGGMFRRFAMPAIVAETYADNPASARVLERAGFEPAGERRGACSPVRGGEDEIRLWRLSRARWQERAR